MIEMTVTEFPWNLSTMFDRIEYKHEEILLIHHNHKIARIIPGSLPLTALEAMEDLCRALPEFADKDWLKDSLISGSLEEETRDPWDI